MIDWALGLGSRELRREHYASRHGVQKRQTQQQLLDIMQGCHGQGKKSGKLNFFQVREKSGNFDMSQGNLEKMQKVREKSENFKFPLKWYGYGSLLTKFYFYGQQI